MRDPAVKMNLGAAAGVMGRGECEVTNRPVAWSANASWARAEENMDKADLLHDLERWQACSHPVLAHCKPQELFDASFVGRYDRLHRDIWYRLIRVHGTIFTLKRLRTFPFDALYAPGEMEFWRLVIENFLDTAVVMLHGLVNDTGASVHSLPTFRSDIMQAPWLRNEHRELLQQTLRERKINAVVDLIAKRVQAIRHSRIAHRLVDRESGSLDESATGVSLDDLRQLLDAAHRIFGALTFGSACVTLVGDMAPTTVGGKPQPTCLDTVLTAVLRDSSVVNTPERRAPWWPMDRKYISPEQLRLMNELRQQIGLPEV
jgi:hypothetical protein